MSSIIAPLTPGNFFHIYNRGINSGLIFFSQDNYQFFLDCFAKYVLEFVDIFAYCLLPNHFHLLIRIRDDSFVNISRQFSNMFNSYAKAINKRENRHGSLFEKPFRRKLISNDAYLYRLIFYIHSNPKHHKIHDRFDTYIHSSYRAIISDKMTNLQRDSILDWFGGRHEFVKFHSIGLENSTVNQFMLEHDFR
ncbi:MAG: hypothetical protein DWQ05_11145 [Calditrichaeota bacterium]|nr:MAG: hypothetical protein DWQ05_11145 [Calditrichota bacterium]